MSEEKELLIVTSKLKKYIKAQGFNTAGTVPEILSNKIREICDNALLKTKSNKRKTLMDADFE
ncbi:MAG: hypothetical protein OEV66_11385 [Spirochaetia bacterium]|nr:hypothetical protein [Spirochaetia bacterium]